MALPFVLSLSLLVGLSNAGVGSDPDNKNPMPPSESGGHHKDFPWASFKTCNIGKRQSPVDLVTSTAICSNKTSDIVFINFNQSDKVRVENNGNTGTVTGFQNWTRQPQLKRMDRNLTYKLIQIHFHWDMGNNGSEHSIDGKLSTAEMHMVFTRGDLDFETAKNSSDGIVVVGVLLDVFPGTKLGIYEDLKQVEDESGKKFTDPHFELEPKVPENAEYFRYDGSLTTPKCEENVHWIVYKKPMGMAKTELDAMRHLHDKEHFVIDRNHRNVQLINDRKVYLHSPNCRK